MMSNLSKEMIKKCESIRKGLSGILEDVKKAGGDNPNDQQEDFMDTAPFVIKAYEHLLLGDMLQGLDRQEHFLQVCRNITYCKVESGAPWEVRDDPTGINLEDVTYLQNDQLHHVYISDLVIAGVMGYGTDEKLYIFDKEE